MMFQSNWPKSTDKTIAVLLTNFNFKYYPTQEELFIGFFLHDARSVHTDQQEDLYVSKVSKCSVCWRGYCHVPGEIGRILFFEELGYLILYWSGWVTIVSEDSIEMSWIEPGALHDELKFENIEDANIPFRDCEIPERPT